MLVQFSFPPSLFDRLFEFAFARGITTDEAVRRAVKAQIDGACPHCGSENVKQTAKHSDLCLDDSDTDLEYDDVTIHYCSECGRHHAHVG